MYNPSRFFGALALITFLVQCKTDSSSKVPKDEGELLTNIEVDSIKNLYKSKFSDLQIIINETDPIGLLDMGSSIDVYQNEVAHIIVQLDSNLAPKEILQIVYDAFLRSFKEEEVVGSKESYMDLANMVFTWIEKGVILRKDGSTILNPENIYFQEDKMPEKQEYRTVESVVELYQKRVLLNLKEDLEEHDLNFENLQLSLLAFKEDRILEVYGRNDEAQSWEKFKTYDFTAFSGYSGPKLKQGDRQIPEGVYQIELLNPNSKYHLSLRVNYPNVFDKRQALKDGRTNLGGDIMIHGRDVTVGCIPIGDESIEELFILAANGFQYGIPIIISPIDFRKEKQYTEILEINWEQELYTAIQSALEKY